MISENSKSASCCDTSCGGETSGDDGANSGEPAATEAIDVARGQRTVFDVTGLCCQSEVQLVADALGQVGGIDDHGVSIAAGTVTIYHDGDDRRVEKVVADLEKVGLMASPRASVGRSPTLSETPFSASFWVIIAGAILAALAVIAGYGLDLTAASTAFFVASIAVGGIFVFKKAWISLKRRQFSIPILMSVAVVGAAIIGEWFEAATVILLFAFAEWLESQSMARARREIGALMNLAPPKALRLNAEGQAEEVAVEDVVVGDRLRLRPGARVPVDATVEQGRSEVDESTITGESMPVSKGEGSPVYSGTVNGGGVLTVRATQRASQSTLAHIIDAIEEARENQSPTEQFIDRFARVYTPAVIAVAALVALVPPLAFGGGWSDWFYRALVFLVIACPCALVIATPIANVAGLARAAREGLLVKGGKFLELLARIDVMAFDKTGTLTVGKAQVEAIEVVGEQSPEALLLAAARAEAQSEHHLGRAILRRARRDFEPAQFQDRARKIQAWAGEGIEATIDSEGIGDAAAIDDGGEYLVRVGRLDWLARQGVGVDASAQRRFDSLEQGGQTVVAVAIGDGLAGFIALRDALRPSARQALAALRQEGVKAIYMLTGDNEATARVIGDELGLGDQEIGARMLPKDKVARVRQLSTQYDTVAMVGDGVNDGPALAGADLGIAMGAAGTDVALETADVALLGDDLRRLSRAMAIGRMTTTVIYQNVVIALGLKAIFLGLAIAGIATLWMAIVADMGASLIVIFNAIRLLRRRAPEEDRQRQVRESAPADEAVLSA